MSKLIDLINNNKLTLIVSLPENDLEMAEAAFAAGADALQLLLNMREFNTIDQERKTIINILKIVEAPIGISIGSHKDLHKKELNEIEKLGFDYINIGVEHLSPDLLKSKKLARVLSLNSRYTLDELIELTHNSFQAVDAAIIPTADPETDLVVGDLQSYISIILSANLPVIIPTQRHIRPSEVSIIADTGAKGLLLTKTVLGTTAKHVADAVCKFKTAIDEMGGESLTH
ncbi:MAG: hypothetical protein QME05_00080 [Candidatus Margulisbacteria bacterium]|nr:hypothetical protein [Candidatus Margulisiibacteriota bacterium]